MSALTRIFLGQDALAADRSAAFERAVLEASVAACDRTSPLKTQDRPTLRVRCRRAVTLFSRSGPITVVRSIYTPDGSSKGKTCDPVRVRCGALGHWLPATSAAMAMLVEHVPQREAQEISSHLRLLLSAASSFWKQTQAIGELYMAHQEAVEEQCIHAVTVPEKAAGRWIEKPRPAMLSSADNSRRAVRRRQCALPSRARISRENTGRRLAQQQR